MAKAKHEFLVGYAGDYKCVYGNDIGRKGGALDWSAGALKLTAHQAQRLLNHLPCDGGVIYKLVPVTKPAKRRKGWIMTWQSLKNSRG